MSHQNTARRSRIAATRRECPACGLRSVEHETCLCCDQEWIVCHGCALALTRVA
jgi:hypothetical protein